MSEQTEQALRNWTQIDDDGGRTDAAQEHFDDFGRWYDIDVAAEGNRVLGLMLGVGIEPDSPIAAVMAAVATQAAEGAFASVAAALGISAWALELAVAHWYEDQDDPPPPVSAARLLELVAEGGSCLRQHLAAGAPA